MWGATRYRLDRINVDSHGRTDSCNTVPGAAEDWPRRPVIAFGTHGPALW